MAPPFALIGGAMFAFDGDILADVRAVGVQYVQQFEKGLCFAETFHGLALREFLIRHRLFADAGQYRGHQLVFCRLIFMLALDDADIAGGTHTAS